MAFGLNLSTLGNLGRAASRGIEQNTAFNEQQRLLGGQEADKAASMLLLKAAVDPTPENIQAATDAMGNASGEFTQRLHPCWLSCRNWVRRRHRKEPGDSSKQTRPR